MKIPLMFKANKRETVPVATVNRSGRHIQFIIDTDSSVNIINHKTFQMLEVQDLQQEDRPIFPYDTSDALKAAGKFKGTFKTNTTQTQAGAFVVERKGNSLLSYDTSMQLNLVKVNCRNIQQMTDIDNIEQKFPEVFIVIGNFEIKLHIDDTVTQVVQTHRRMPYHVRDKVESELKRLLKEVTEPTNWISPKPYDSIALRLCVDMRAANKAIRRVRKSNR